VANRAGRTQDCDLAQARERLDQARRFLDIAELAAGTEDADLQYGSVGAAIAILAGIAAADAACCAALKRRSRSDDHRDAADLVAQIKPGGAAAGRLVRKLISLKDDAHYGFLDITPSRVKSAMRQARQLTDFAESVVLRST
jgi:hypothetical protein